MGNFFFIFGAVGAFALLETVVSRMFRDKLRGEPSEVVALGTALSVMSITIAVGATSLTAAVMEGWQVWPLSAFISTTIYLMVVALEMAFAEQAEKQ